MRILLSIILLTLPLTGSYILKQSSRPLGKIPIFHYGNWEVCHKEVLALPCFGNGFTCKLLEAHPQISAVALLANLSDESSQKFC
jgi:hypothetical protein